MKYELHPYCAISPRAPKNPHRQPSTDNQRLISAQKEYRIQKLNRTGASAEEIATEFNVRESSVLRAARLAEVSSEAVQKKIENGELSIRRAEAASHKAQRDTGIRVKKSTSEADRKKVQETQERILEECRIDGEPEEAFVKNKDAVEFNGTMLTSVFDRKRWQKNVKKIQDTLCFMENMPGLFNDCSELLEAMRQESSFKMMIEAVIESIQKAKAGFREPNLDKETQIKNLKTLSPTILKICSTFDLSDDIEKSNEWVFRELLLDKYAATCDALVSSLEALRHKLFENQEEALDDGE
jgi:hypothetical protein